MRSREEDDVVPPDFIQAPCSRVPAHVQHSQIALRRWQRLGSQLVVAQIQ